MPRQGPETRLLALLLALALQVAGCAAGPTQPGSAVRELTEVPFFPHQDFQCGPAALATVMKHRGAAVAPRELMPEVYIPARRGSLQLELQAAARRYDLLPYVIAPDVGALRAEVAVGNPVLVLLGLGGDQHPLWHYAVVIGFGPRDGTVILRSGTIWRQFMDRVDFGAAWGKSDNWGMIVLPPGRYPASAEETAYVEAALGLEHAGRLNAALASYRAALVRWPADFTALFGAGNACHGLGDLSCAERIFREAAARYPGRAAVHNNLAQTLADQGRLAEAQAEAEIAVRIGGPLLGRCSETLAQIRGLREASGPR